MFTRQAGPSVSASRTRAETVAQDDYPQNRVPQHARRGFLSLLFVLVGFVFFTPTMLAGARLSGAFAWSDLIVILAVGSLILGLYVAVLSLIGARSGLTTVLLARYSLGRYGAKYASLLLGGTQVCWYAVTAVFLSELLVQAFGFEGHTWLVVVLSSILTGVTAYYGYRGLEFLSGLSVPLMLVLCLWVLHQALDNVGGWSGLAAVTPAEQDGIAWATAVTIVVGTFVSGGTQTPNWSRFARRPWQGFVAALCAFLVFNLLMLFFGAVGAIAFQATDFVAVLLQLDLVAVAVLLLFFNVWTTQENTAYAFGVAGAEMFNVPAKRPFIIGGVAIAIVLALTGIYEALPQYLVLLGILIPPLGGVVIGDHLFVWRGRLPRLDQVRFLPVRWSCATAYLLGLATAFVSEQLSFGLPPVHGIAVAILTVPVAERVFHALGVRTDHEELEEDPWSP
ncbi:cytosine permease [Nocardiopsis sp. EMB25]|uniref:cytosine permease n=1 Tax=Nocardiopsis sp. EMB25 TaxID=2835867 RepID=UPI0022834D1B|nr:cytosine permease [Nocardiopsis sp. EMB25]MCY9783937.1 cytosine permease [Nocardiopsis sp. EMB25]